ncbi:MAG: hypothetical protein RIC18_11695 [Hoeflea sp.]|uniref:hypothetical protein n=1 Tax=Hoeflea sp. TaxID=1940281 RepID=UPI0032F079C2
MTTDPGQTHTLFFEEVCYGKPVRSSQGPLRESAVYGVNLVTLGIESPLNFVPANFLGRTSLNSGMIDPAFAQRGALIVKAVDEGLAIMRMRYRPEAGEGESGRQFLLSRTIVLLGIQSWDQIPQGLFAWAERELTVQPFVFDQSQPSSPQTAKLPPFLPRDVDWFDQLSRPRQIQLGSAYQAITKRVGWTVSRAIAQEERQPPSALIAADLDVIASLPRQFPLRKGATDQFILNIGLDPALTPGAVSYFPGHAGSAIEAPDLHALREAISSGKPDPSPSKSEIRQTSSLHDSLERKIGSEPIPLKWQL